MTIRTQVIPDSGVKTAVPALEPLLVEIHEEGRAGRHVRGGEEADESRAKPWSERPTRAGEATQELRRRNPDRRDGRSVDRQALHRPDQEPRAPAECLAHVHVLAAGSGVTSGELGEAQRAEQSEGAAQQPGDEREPRATELRGDETGRAKNAAAHHDAHHHGQPIHQAQRAFEVGHEAGNLHAKTRGRRCAPNGYRCAR